MVRPSCCLHTGNQNLGHASFGAWTMYGLGSENENLPGFIVLVSGGKTPSAGKSVWGSGYLPSVFQGVQCRSKGDPVLYLSNPDSITREQRRRSLDALQRLNERTFRETGDPEVLTRISQYEMAFRMQTHATEAFDLGQETADVQKQYGAEPARNHLPTTVYWRGDWPNAASVSFNCSIGDGTRTVHRKVRRSTADSTIAAARSINR